MKRFPFPHTMVSITFLVAFIFFFFNAKTPFNDPDTPWHIAAGDEILNTHSIPSTDPWSFTAGGTEWYNIAWLWDVGLSVINTHFGLEGIFLTSILMLALILAVLCHYLYKRPELSEDPIKITVALVGLALWDFTAARPQLISFLFAIFFHHYLHKSRTESSNKQLYILFPLLMIIWVNVHGGFLIAATLFAVYLLEAYLNKNWLWFRRIFISGVLCFLALFVNPWGWEISIATLRTLHSVITSNIQEWEPFSYGTSLATSVLMLSFILISNPANKHVHLADKCITFLWLLSAFNAFRNFAPFAILAAPYIATNLQYAITLKPLPDISGHYFRQRMFLFTALIVTVMMIPSVASFLHGQDFANPKLTPEKEIAYIAEHYPDSRFLNHYNMGGKLIYYGKGQPKVFIDGRAGTVYSEKLLKDYLDFISLAPEGKKIFDKYNIDGVILESAHKTPNKVIANHYGLKPVYKGEFATIYIRKKQE